jgi:hypothetical protein
LFKILGLKTSGKRYTGLATDRRMAVYFTCRRVLSMSDQEIRAKALEIAAIMIGVKEFLIEKQFRFAAEIEKYIRDIAAESFGIASG